jgi:hypothetical protein
MKVLLVDNDFVSTSSSLAGLRGKGFIQLIKEGSDGRGALASLEIGPGSLDVLKLFSDGVPVEVEREDARSLREKLLSSYKGILKERGYDFLVIDNDPAVTPLDPVFSFLMDACSDQSLKSQTTGIMVMEPDETNVKAIIRYARVLRSYGLSCLDIVIANKVESDMESVRKAFDFVHEVMEETGARLGALVPFLDELRRLPVSIEALHIPTQVMEIGNAIVRRLHSSKGAFYVYIPDPNDPLRRVALTLSSAMVKLYSFQFTDVAKRLIDVMKREFGEETRICLLDPEGKVSAPGSRRIALMPAYLSDRLKQRGIEDSVKMARRLAQDTVSSCGRSSSPSLLIVSSTDSLEPVSTYSDQSLLSKEFWREFLAHVRSSDQSMIVFLFCDVASGRCDALDGLADFTLSSQPSEKFQISVVHSRIP